MWVKKEEMGKKIGRERKERGDSMNSQNTKQLELRSCKFGKTKFSFLKRHLPKLIYTNISLKPEKIVSHFRNQLKRLR